MKQLNLIILAAVAIYLLAAPSASGQGGNPPAGTKESGATSGKGIAVEQIGEGKASVKKAISSPEFPKPLGPYSHAVVSGGFVFVAGQGPINPKTQKMELGDIKAETRLELANISKILTTANSSIENVVKSRYSLPTLMTLRQ